MNLLDVLRYEFGSIKTLSEKMDLHPNAIYRWVAKNEIPVSRIKTIELLSEGRITREQLRPDLFVK